MLSVYYLGAHMPHWLGDKSPLPHHVPMCVSRVRLARRKSFPRARGRWLLDSGGFSVLSPKRLPEGRRFSDWDITPQQHVREVAVYADEIGNLDAAAPMDWMCEDPALAKTGLTVTEHLRRTVTSFLELRWLSRRSSRPDLPIFPVLQGNSVETYLHCADLYERYGVDLTAEPLVGVGSVCRLQSTAAIVDIFAALHRHFGGRVNLHGFGVKVTGLALAGPAMYSADSMAWSDEGRREHGCRHGLGHKSEANCHHYALEWYERVLRFARAMTLPEWEAIVDRHVPYEMDPLLEIEETAPNTPTQGQRLAHAMRMFMPEGTQAAHAAALDAFLAIPELSTPANDLGAGDAEPGGLIASGH